MPGDFVSGAINPGLQIRRAWFVLAASFSVFVVLFTAAVVISYWVYRHATTPESASLAILSGGGALVRSPGDADWRLVDSETRLRERDQVSTALGTVVQVTMFDGSTVEIAEDTVVSFTQMRSSRFLNRTKLIELRLERGTVYLSTAGHGEFAYSESIVHADHYAVVMPSERGRSNGGAFLVEIVPGPAGVQDDKTVRTAVLRGQAFMTFRGESVALQSNQQVIVDSEGELGPITSTIRELIINGSFDQGLAGWIEFITRSPLSPDGFPTGASIELVRDAPPRGNSVAVEFLRSSDAVNTAAAGIRQRVGKTIRLQSSLQLELDIKISDQQPPASGADPQQFPLNVEINYIDADGQEARWSHGYYVFSDSSSPIPRDRGTRVERDTWQRIVFDLRNLSPLPRQISSIVVYASGDSYQTRVANVSLTSAEPFEED